jgi:hypothetical protein
MWTCPKCQSKVDPSFEVCWNCGTTAEGVEDPTFQKADEVLPDKSPTETDMPVGEAPIPVASPPEAGELVECYWALDLMQAKFLADQLSEAGIPAVADTSDLHDALRSQSSGPKVRVRAVDLARAKAWLDEFDRQSKPQGVEVP